MLNIVGHVFLWYLQCSDVVLSIQCRNWRFKDVCRLSASNNEFESLTLLLLREFFHHSTIYYLAHMLWLIFELICFMDLQRYVFFRCWFVVFKSLILLSLLAKKQIRKSEKVPSAYSYSIYEFDVRLTKYQVWNEISVTPFLSNFKKCTFFHSTSAARVVVKINRV